MQNLLGIGIGVCFKPFKTLLLFKSYPSKLFDSYISESSDELEENCDDDMLFFYYFYGERGGYAFLVLFFSFVKDNLLKSEVV